MKKMNIEKAIEILELHNKWRRDNENKYLMAEPKKIGKAIDLVVSEFKNLDLQKVSQQRELLIAFSRWMDKNVKFDGIRDEEIDSYLTELKSNL